MNPVTDAEMQSVESNAAQADEIALAGSCGQPGSLALLTTLLEAD